MLTNYLKTALRMLSKYRGFSFINIAGLTLSMSVCLVIILFLRQEMSFDQFHRDKDRIYRVNSEWKQDNGAVDQLAASPAPLADVLRQDYPEVESAVTLRKLRIIARVEENGYSLEGIVAEPSFFDIFGFELRAGHAPQAFLEPFQVVLSAETAKKLFGEEMAVGKKMELEGIGQASVTGVLAKPAGKSHLQPELILSFATLHAANDPRLYLDNWEKGIGRYYTYIRLREGSKPSVVESKFPGIVATYFPEDKSGTYAFFLQPLTDIRFGPALSNKIERQVPATLLQILSALALVLTLAAAFNYVNLSVARSLKRAREVGIRKVAGAFRRQLILQFLGEAVLVSWFALGLSLIILELWFIPEFNNLWLIQHYLETDIAFGVWSDPDALLISVGFATSVGLLAGLYPAVVLSSHLPSVVLRGTSHIKGFLGLTLRRVLIVSQFALSVLFIVSTLVIQRQSEHMLAADYGFDKDRIINVALQNIPYDLFRTELLKNPGVQNVSAVSIIPGTGDLEMELFQTSGMSEPTYVSYLATDEYFVDNLFITVVAGRNLSFESAADKSGGILLNESAVARLLLDSPQQALGQNVVLRGDNPRSFRVVGVIQDFYYQSLGKTGPLALFYDKSKLNYANIRLTSGSPLATVEFIEKTWKRLNPGYPIDYTFFDEQIKRGFVELQDYIALIGVGTGLILLIACLGLLGIATYNAESRLKEVGIRKVLGASVSGILLFLSADFLKLIAIATVIATPVAWLVNQQLLQNFAYRIELGAGVFLIGVSLMLCLALIAIISQAAKAAFLNPVQTLRHE